jgi:uncharacterized secreted protein with C-terminal beta-propeller domain
VVTFRQVDPLYALDLSNPDHPRLLGELKIPGWSSYLHPIGEDLLLGIGQDAVDGSGVRRGLQLSLFDVSNHRRPTRLHRRFLGRGYSIAEYDHHAFLYWPPAQLAVMPISVYDSETSFAGALGVRVGRRSGIDQVGRINHPKPYGVLRAVVVGGSLYTISHAGVDERGLRTFERRGWAEFPSG